MERALNCKHCGEPRYEQKGYLLCKTCDAPMKKRPPRRRKGKNGWEHENG